MHRKREPPKSTFHRGKLAASAVLREVPGKNTESRPGPQLPQMLDDRRHPRSTPRIPVMEIT
jgi:hypothetical protein